MRVCIESPLRGDVARNVTYAELCMLDALERGEAPFLGHLLYPRVLDDERTAHRDAGIAAHLAWLEVADLVAVYEDLGVTSGMRAAIDLAARIGKPYVMRSFGVDWADGVARVARTSGFTLHH